MIGLHAVHARALAVELVRTPAFLVPTLVFPTVLYGFFGAAGATAAGATASLMGFAVFAVMGVCFYQFGVGLADQRDSPWEMFLRTLPVSLALRFAARVTVAALVALLAVGLLLAAAGAFGAAAVPPGRLPLVALALLAGAAPFALLGIALGYAVPAKSAVPVANLIYLPLAFAGGLWIPPERLPEPVAWLSPALPSRQFAELAWWAAGLRPLAPWAVAGLAATTAVAALLARLAFRSIERTAFE